MHHASFTSPKERAIARAKHVKRHSKELEALAAEREALAAEIRAANAEIDKQMHAERLEDVATGKISITTATGGWSEKELTDIREGRERKVVREKLAPKALQKLNAALDSDDDRCVLAAVKIVTDIIAPTKEEIEQINSLKVVDALPLRDQEILARYTNQPKERITKDEL